MVSRKPNPWLLKQSLGKRNEARLLSITLGMSRDLYVQALAALQQVDESEDLSYFGIMGACFLREILVFIRQVSGVMRL